MANNYTEIMKIVNQGNKMGLSNTITRDNGIPLDLSSVQESYNAAIIYAATKAIAYQGQILSADGVVYQIVAESQGTVEIDGTSYANYLKPVGTTPSGDEASINVTAEGLVSLFGFAAAENGKLPMKVDGKLTWKSLEDIGAGDGNDDTTYEFALNTAKNGIIVTPLFNGQPIMEGEEGEQTQKKFELVLDVYTKSEADTKFLAKADYTPYDDTALANRVKVVEDNKANAADVYTKGEVDTAIDDAVKGILGEDIDAAYDTLKEIQDILQGTDGELIDGLIETVDANKQAIAVLNGNAETAGSVAKAIADSEAAAADLYATKQNLTDHSNTMDAKLNDYLKNADAEDTYAKIGDAYTKAETDALIGAPGTPAVKDEEGNVTTEAVPGTGVYQHVYSKDEITALIADITGGESAADVLAALNAYKTTNDTRVKNVEDKNAAQDTAIGNAQSAAEGAQSAAEAAQSTADGAASQAATNKTDIAGILTRLGNVETASGTNTSKVSALEGKVTALEAKDTEIATQIGTLEGNLSTLETNLSAEDARIAALVAGNTTEIGKKANAADVYTKGEVDTKVQEAIDAIPEVDFTPYLKSEDAAKTYAKITALEEEAKTARAAEKANADAIAVLVGAVEGDNAKSVRVIASEEVAKVVNSAPEDFDTLKEIADYIASDKTNAANINNKLAAHDAILAGFGTEEGQIAKVTDAIATAKQEAIDAAAESAKQYAYELPGATAEILGGVKSAANDAEGNVAVNAVYVDATSNVGSVKAVSTDVLVNGENELVLFGGKATV